MEMNNIFTSSELRRLLWRFKPDFLRVVLLSFVANVLLLVPTIYMLQLYDRVLVGRNELTLLAVSLQLVLFLGIMAIAERLRSSLLVHVGTEIDEELASPLLRASFMKSLKGGSKDSGAVFGDLVSIRQFLTGSGVLSILDLPWTPVFIGVLFFLHPAMGVLGIVFALIQLLMTVRNNKAVLDVTEQSIKAASRSAVYVESKLRNSESVFAMGMTPHLIGRWSGIHDQYLEKHQVAHAKQNKLQSWSKFVRYSMQSFTLGFGAFLVIHGKLSPSSIIAGNLLMSRALQPLDQLVNTWQQFIQSRMSFERLEALLAAYPEKKFEERDWVPEGMLELRELSATVEGRDAPIIDKMNLEIPAGSLVVVIGESGSGKSTLARCMLGVWPNTEGEVLYDGHPIKEIDPMQLGQNIGYVPQDIELMDGTIAENIARFSALDAEKVIEAAKKTGIHEMILRFPKGYDTPIGQSGSVLSAGQRQRVALARALYGNPSLLVLDEPNANLDDAGEKLFRQTIQSVKQEKKTIILISHRMNMLSVADYILKLKNGKIVQFGSREQVLSALQKKSPVPVVTVV